MERRLGLRRLHPPQGMAHRQPRRVAHRTRDFRRLIELPMILADAMKRHRHQRPALLPRTRKPRIIQGLGRDPTQLARNVRLPLVFQTMHQIHRLIATAQHRTRKLKSELLAMAVRTLDPAIQHPEKRLPTMRAKWLVKPRQCRITILTKRAPATQGNLTQLAARWIKYVERRPKHPPGHSLNLPNPHARSARKPSL